VSLVFLMACGSEAGMGSTDGEGTSGAASTGVAPASTSGSSTEQPTSGPTSTEGGTVGGTTEVEPGTTSTSMSTGSEGSASSTGGVPLESFSFFVTSYRAMQELSGSQEGFGGDLRFGEDGAGAGLRGADKICATIAEESMPGAGAKGWRAFLSATADENGDPVHAIDRVGEGPWYDRLGRVVAMSKADLANERPGNADAAIVDDLPNEDGVPNHQPDPNMNAVDNHDMLTGSDKQGHLVGADATCSDWTSSVGEAMKRPKIGHSWPRSPDNGRHWISDHDAGGCGAGANINSMGGPQPGDYSVGAGGGYGGIYCFALTP